MIQKMKWQELLTDGNYRDEDDTEDGDEDGNYEDKDGNYEDEDGNYEDRDYRDKD